MLLKSAPSRPHRELFQNLLVLVHRVPKELAAIVNQYSPFHGTLKTAMQYLKSNFHRISFLNDRKKGSPLHNTIYSHQLPYTRT